MPNPLTMKGDAGLEEIKCRRTQREIRADPPGYPRRAFKAVVRFYSTKDPAMSDLLKLDMDRFDRLLGNGK